MSGIKVQKMLLTNLLFASKKSGTKKLLQQPGSLSQVINKRLSSLRYKVMADGKLRTDQRLMP